MSILITLGEIAQYLRVSEDTVVAWKKSEGLPVKRIGNRMVSSKEMLDRWLEKKLSAETGASSVK